MLEQLCRLAASLSDPAARLELDAESVDWPRLCDLADEHRLAGYLFTRLEDHAARRSLPPAAIARWRQSSVRQWARNRFLLAETSRLAQAFEHHGLDVLHMKGALMSLRLYGRLDARAISDIDLLVRRPSEVPAAEACLLSCGYRRASRLLLGQRITRAFTYQLEYWKGEIPVELHWSFQREVSLRFDLEEIWRRSETMETGGRTYRVLSCEDTLVAYVVSVPVDLRLGKLRARTLLEIYLLLLQLPDGFDWDAWLARRAREGTRRISAASVSVALALFGTHPRLEALARALAPFLRESDRDALLEALRAPEKRSPFRRRLRALRMSEGSLASALAWWAVSLPARILAHPTRSRAHLF